jgi:hypothetical protein
VLLDPPLAGIAAGFASEHAPHTKSRPRVEARKWCRARMCWFMAAPRVTFSFF